MRRSIEKTSAGTARPIPRLAFWDCSLIRHRLASPIWAAPGHLFQPRHLAPGGLHLESNQGLRVRHHRDLGSDRKAQLKATWEPVVVAPGDQQSREHDRDCAADSPYLCWAHSSLAGELFGSGGGRWLRVMEHNIAGLGLVERTDVGTDCVAIPCSCNCGAAVLNEVDDLVKCLRLNVSDQQRCGLWRLGLEL
jgi:hypothetical protein